MEYLHAEGLIHGDLRGSNILVDNDHHPRLADFGLGSIAESTAGSHTSKGGGSIRWMVPELLRAEGDFQRTLPTDVYSYGCVCVEVRHSMSSIPYLLKLVKHMTRRQSSLLIRLRTGHAPLNRHLWSIKAAESPGCNACGRDEEETVRHFLVSCPAHEQARAVLRNKIGARNASNISTLLTQRKFLKPLFKFVDTTGRFRGLLGTISGDYLNFTIYD
jgi:serine/threonine protein kinase